LSRCSSRKTDDRVPTREEILKLVQYPDRRIKAIVYIMASSGIRLGAWDFLQWKHLSPVCDEKGNLLGAKLIVYAGELEEYYTFVTPEVTGLKFLIGIINIGFKSFRNRIDF
jgi:hypothetical protein